MVILIKFKCVAREKIRNNENAYACCTYLKQNGNTVLCTLSIIMKNMAHSNIPDMTKIL